MQLAREVHHSHENVEAQCPHCCGWSLYNRASDLGPPLAPGADEVTCRASGCDKRYRLIGTGNHPYELILWDAESLLAATHYVAATLLAAQAIEVFSAFFVRRVLVYLPVPSDPSISAFRERGKVGTLLYDAVKDFSFKCMVNVMLNVALLNPPPRTLNESIALIANIKGLTSEPADAALSSGPNAAAGALLLRLKRTRVGSLRNQVVHKDAYLPSLSEAKAAVREAGDILFPLAVHLGVFASFDQFGPKV
jgi:hypothetical protein